MSDRDKRARRQAWNSLVRESEALTNLLKCEIIVGDVMAAVSVLNTTFQAAEAAHRLVNEALLDDEETTDAQLDEEEMTWRSHSKAYHQVLHYANCEIDKATAAKNPAGDCLPVNSNQRVIDASTTSEMIYRRPKLVAPDLGQFSGEYKDWLPFWGRFAKIHDAEDLADVDKFQYLLQALVPGSHAEEVVQRYSPTGANYPLAVKALQSRFGRVDVQVEIHLRQLLDTIWVFRNANERSIRRLYDSVHGKMNQLRTLHITPEQYGPIMYLFIESCLPDDVLQLWLRSVDYRSIVLNKEEEVGAFFNERLAKLMGFMEHEADNETHRLIKQERARSSNQRSLNTHQSINSKQSAKPKRAAGEPTTSSFHTSSGTCIFCTGKHWFNNCTVAGGMSFDERRANAIANHACLRCLGVGHFRRDCVARVRCNTCGKSHNTMICPETPEDANSNAEGQRNVFTLGNGTSPDVFFQSVLVTAVGDCRLIVRVLFDSGSHRSYVSDSVVGKLGLSATHTETFAHALFGGQVTDPQTHNAYWLDLEVGSNIYQIVVLQQERLSGSVMNVREGPWIEELRQANIKLSDVDNSDPFDLLIGADVLGKLLTGKRYELKSGLVAIETKLGWTLMGKVPGADRLDTANLVYSAYLAEASLRNLWELDVLGIEDPTRAVSKVEAAVAAKELFLDTVVRDADGRYEVCLPWLVDRPPLPANRFMAERRLESTRRKLEKMHMVETYDEIFKEWQRCGIIEKAPPSNEGVIHYLPHRPIVKSDSLTTKIRPVFDASAKERGYPSLNDCVEKGMNLIELIPKMLLKFRIKRVGVIADIEKAFLQIGVKREDRDALRFLWIGEDGNPIEYRHKRVVFGVNCSPFLLGATIEYHLERCLRQINQTTVLYTQKTVRELQRSFYVDNCVTSLDNFEEATTFEREARLVMSAGKFELRGWERSGDTKGDVDVSVLGLCWEKDKDSLKLSEKCFRQNNDFAITKRNILAVTQKVFDPVGLVCPVMIMPKLLLQELWKDKTVGWDTILCKEMSQRFQEWYQELILLKELRIPRWIGGENSATHSIHVFCDASQLAYAAVIYLRTENAGKVQVNLLLAKSRVAPMQNISIPRLELMAATIAARLYVTAKESLDISAESHFWSDSATTIAWIQRSDLWAPFVGNRVKEIRELTDPMRWRHVPGELNPADRPSRGCTAKQLVKSQWWEGPKWLTEQPGKWPLSVGQVNEEAVTAEKRKGLVFAMSNGSVVDEFHLKYFGKFEKCVRMLAWLLRFVHNCRRPPARKAGELDANERDNAETLIWALVQRANFHGVDDENLQSLAPIVCKDGLIRVKSRVCRREDSYAFLYPILLPKGNVVVERMIFQTHVELQHAGTSAVLNAIREKYWVIGGRRGVREVIRRCMACQRFTSKAPVTQVAPLPVDRVSETQPFEIVGVDFAGPLLLKNRKKAYICIFTCAVYRAVHLEVTCSLSSATFIQTLRRFIARRGRPRKLISDNGTNFRGVDNFFRKVEWSEVQTYASTRKIEWQFNPPTAAWWGGFWERLIQTVKQLLRRTLGKACLRYEELITVVCDCEAVMNNRPITYVSDDPTDLVALTPNMFLRDIRTDAVPECNVVNSKFTGRRAKYEQTLREDLRQRFRNEYLGQLKGSQPKRTQDLRVGQLVLIHDDNRKRMEWPLGRVTQLIKGQDGIARVARVKTAKGLFLRPLPRLYPLECEDNCELNNRKERESVKHRHGVPRVDSAIGNTRSGRLVRVPKRYLD